MKFIATILAASLTLLNFTAAELISAQDVERDGGEVLDGEYIVMLKNKASGAGSFGTNSIKTAEATVSSFIQSTGNPRIKLLSDFASVGGLLVGGLNAKDAEILSQLDSTTIVEANAVVKLDDPEVIEPKPDKQ